MGLAAGCPLFGDPEHFGMLFTTSISIYLACHRQSQVVKIFAWTKHLQAVTDIPLLTQVDFFSFIFVSMGDGQNIEKGQSTFLSQLNFYSQLLQQIGSKEAKKYSLILLDELGSGTEAHAGGAIGQAIIEKILQNDRCRVVATTHSSRLKALSVDSNEIDCATVLPEILTDDDTVQEAIPQTSSVLRRRRPTFKLQYGIIGESLALDAAGRCIPPLPEDVLTRVSELLLGEKAGTESDVSSQYMQAMQKSFERNTISLLPFFS